MALSYFKGTISEIGEIISGTSRNGNTWERQTLMLDIPGYQGSIYKVVFQVSGNQINAVMQFNHGDKVVIGASIYAREWNGKWYNNVDLVNIEHQFPEAETQTAPAPKIKDLPAEELDPAAHSDDLPW